MMLLWKIFLVFTRVSLFSWGGGPASLALMQRETTAQGWVTPPEFADAVALGNALPGPIAPQVSAFVGYKLAGVPGAVAAAGGTVLPATLLMLVMVVLFFGVKDSPAVRAMLTAVRPVVVGLLVWTAYEMAVTVFGVREPGSASLLARDAGLLRPGGVLRLWDLAAHRTIGQPFSGHTSAVRSATFSPDGKVLASGGDDGKIFLWDSSSGKVLATLSGHTSSVFSVAFSPKEYILASGSDDRTVRLWDAVTGQLLFPPLVGHTDRVRSVAFSPDGNLLASASDDGSLRLWDVSTGQPAGAPMTGHTSYVLSVTFSSDGKLLASSSADRTVRLWDVATGQQVGEPLTGHDGPVRSVAFSPDSQLLATGGEDHTLRLWDTGMSAYQSFACRRANRNLTPAEWTYFFGNEPYESICPDLDR